MVTEKSLIQDSAQPPQESNDDDIVVSVEGVSKKFCRDLKKSLWYGLRDMTGEMIGGSQEGEDLRPGEFWALQDVSLQLRKGEALGLVGPNGSGKTTLLRMIAGLIKPDEGRISVKGRLAPLLAAGVGFNPVLTGRENIYANLSILGLSKKEIDERFDDIVEFAEIPHAIGAPVRSYSTGMKARLGFACAIHVDPEILLIDEVLAVGDVKFRLKCYEKIEQLRRDQQVSIILVAHNSNVVILNCETATYLKQGSVACSGLSDSVVNQYENDMAIGLPEPDLSKVYYPPKISEEEDFDLRISYVCFKDIEGYILQEPITGQDIYLCIGFHSNTSINKGLVRIAIRGKNNSDQSLTLLISSNLHNEQKYKTYFSINPGEGEITGLMDKLTLVPGKYQMKISIHEGNQVFDIIENFRFNVVSEIPIAGSSFYQSCQWKIKYH